MKLRALTHEERFKSSPDDEFWACVICGQMWPARQMKFQDGIESDRRCPNHYAPKGGTIARTLARAEASNEAARLTERHAAPPRFGGWFDETALPALVHFSARPLLLHRGGAAAALTIQGTTLAAGDTIAYEHAGITDSVAPALTPVTLDSDGNPQSPYVDTLVLAVQASSAVPIGTYSLTYEGTAYRNVFDVRD